MNFLKNILFAIENQFNKIGLCATTGFMAGAMTGFILFTYYFGSGSYPSISTLELFEIIGIFTLFCFITILFILYVFCRFTIGSIFIPVIINCVITCSVCIFLVYITHGWKWAFFIGALIGLLVGKLLCLICSILNRKLWLV